MTPRLSEATWAALQARVARLERDLRRSKASAERLRESARRNKPTINDLRARVANRDARIAALEELLAEARMGEASRVPISAHYSHVEPSAAAKGR